MESTVTRIDGEHCSAILYPDVVEYVLHRADKATVDALIGLFDQVIARRYPHGHTGKVRLIYDARAAGALPLFWLFTRGREWVSQNRAYTPTEVRIAMLYRPHQSFHQTFFMRMLEQFQPFFTTQTHRFGFFEEDRAAALVWLRAEEAPDHLRETVYRPF
jgi:hypothetical protein